MSNSIEELIASIIASGPVENRPPHILLEDFFDMKLPFRGVKNFSKLVVLYTAFSFCANTVLSEDNKFSVLEEFKVGEMKKLILHESPKAVSDEVFFSPNNDPIISATVYPSISSFSLTTMLSAKYWVKKESGPGPTSITDINKILTQPIKASPINE